METIEKKRKILIITGSLVSGGTERFVAFLCNNLNPDKYEIVLLLCSSADSNYTINANVRIIDLGLKKLKYLLYKLPKVLRKERADIVFSTLTAINVIVSIIRIIAPKNAVYILRESTILTEVQKHFSRPKAMRWLIKTLYPRFDAIVAQSVAMKTDMVQNFRIDPNKIKQIYNPIMPHGLKLGAKPGVTELITVGNIRKEKGHDRILKALKLLKINFHYTIVGGGKERELEKIKRLVEQLHIVDKVTFEGAQKDPFTYLRRSTLFLQGSYFEGFPNSLLEAHSVGLPVIAFDCPGGTKEIVCSGENGFLVPDNDLHLYAAAIEKAISYPFEPATISENVLKRFGQREVLGKYEALFDLLLMR
ncbi:MAG: glycosyltransferase [Chitinophagaceae bacterium]